MPMNNTYRPRMTKDIVFREEDDGAFLFDPIKDELRCLNDTGVLIYKAVNGKNSIDDIVKELTGIYPEVEEGQIREDVESFMEDLETRGYLENEGNP